MKLKIKLPLLFSLIFVILSVSFFLYLRSYAFEAIIYHAEEVKNSFDKENQLLASKIMANGSGDSTVFASMDELGNENITISLYDRDMTHLIHQGGHVDSTLLHTSWHPVSDHSGRLQYFIKVERNLKIRDFTMPTFVIKTITILLISLAILFVLLTLYFHKLITNPIHLLNRRLSIVALSSSLPLLAVRRNDEIGMLYGHVAQMEARIQTARREQTDLIGVIAHDLKTPLTSINGFLELMRTHRQLQEEQKEEYIHLIEKKAGQMTDILQQFSHYAKSEMQLQHLSMFPIPMESLYVSLASEYDAELSGYDHELIWSHSFKAGDFIVGNETALRRVFANLFSNCVRYGNKEELTIRMNGHMTSKKIIIAIEDDGVGVPEADLPRIFDLFYTVDHARQSEKGGTGLGLASCKSIIERHGGSIEGYRANSGGLGIVIELPVDKE
ncbi:HAMP domain-containing sensor histidine kinase [Paenibacillus sp. N3.4]|uniref:HAMP domain-containing sensor histidine kinase n=1 Tax=Paenibacillus sp. N3.4 TaxID=2603222 RepID=UPI001650219B|nr:HAMP domain-containing sensor histidine kinase [Paenibacillus sp. N3.4]